VYVEDDDATAYLFQIARGEANLWPRVFRVTDGEQALAFLSRTATYRRAPAPDLVLLHLNLPCKSGFEVLAGIRQNSALRELPVVVFRNSVRPEDRARAREWARPITSASQTIMTSLSKALAPFAAWCRQDLFCGLPDAG
jgi:CheY-like chemotaxis protein